MTSQVWAEYNSIDGVVTHQVWDAIEPELDEGGYRETYEWTKRLFPPLIYMMTNGLRTDISAIEKAKTDIAEKIEQKEQELSEVAQHYFNVSSPKQCIQYFYGTLGFPPYKNDKGNPTTDDKALARLARKGVKEAKIAQEIRALRKLSGTYLEVAIDSDGRLRSSFNPRGTYGGRLSSSKTIFGTGLNFQNLDPTFKQFIVADPGYVFIEIDKAKAEWVATAYASGDARMIQAVESGEDVHVHTASLMFGVSKETIKKEAKLIGHLTDPDLILQHRKELVPEIFDEANFLPRSMTCRQAGKKSNHGLNYIMGYKRFALENEMPEKESKQMVQLYRETYCNLPLWWESVERQMGRNRTVENCFGRRVRLMGEFDHQLKKDAVAFIPQSTVADLINRGMIQIYEDTSPKMYPISLGAQVHDSILFQYPIQNWNEIASAIAKCHEYLNPTMKYGGREFHIDSDVKIGLNWGSFHKDNNPQGMVEVELTTNVGELAEKLEAVHGSISE